MTILIVPFAGLLLTPTVMWFAATLATTTRHRHAQRRDDTWEHDMTAWLEQIRTT